MASFIQLLRTGLSADVLVPALVSPDTALLVSTCVFMIAVGLFPQSTELAEEGQSPRAETPSTVTEVDMDLDSYQIALEEVLTWLLSAEDTFQEQDDISDDVEEVKEQFATHEVNICSREPYLFRAGPDLGVGVGGVTSPSIHPLGIYQILLYRKDVLLEVFKWALLENQSDQQFMGIRFQTQSCYISCIV